MKRTNAPFICSLIQISLMLFFFSAFSAFGAVPVADFSATPRSGVSPLEVQFTDQSTGNPTGWAWYFGDEDYSENWSEMSPTAVWSTRNSHTCSGLPDGSVILMGGWNGNTAFNDIWHSTDKGATWTEVNVIGNVWSKRMGHSSVVLSDGRIVIMGGGDGYGERYDDIWSSTDKGQTWNLMTTDDKKWSPRTGHSSVALSDDSIILMGGLDGEDQNDVWRSTNNGGSWTLMTENAPWTERRFHSSVALPDDSIVLMGGFDGTASNEVWRSTDMGATWTQMTENAGWSPRSGHTTVALPDSSILLMGGGNKNDVWRSTDKGETWTEITETAPWSARESHAATVLKDGSTLLIGGFSLSGNTRMNDTWRWDTAGSVKQNPAHIYTEPGVYDVALMVSRSGGTSSIHKQEYISVEYPPLIADFSGKPISGVEPLEVQFTDQSTGNPTGWAWYFGEEDFSKTWTPMTSNAGWSARRGHSSVVLPDGSIVLMGGSSRTLGYNDVWRSTDEGAGWTQLTADAPWSSRTGHSSVVLDDGTIVLMGGQTVRLGQLVNDVWNSTDNGKTWTMVNASAPWSAREGHSTVVRPDGTIFLMGGNDGDLKNDVWFSTNKGETWKELTFPAPVWSPRTHHSSVVLFDGSILLMGGYDGSYKNDVWVFSPGSKGWVKITGKIEAQWSGRYGHRSVLLPDGSIILMGGNDGRSRLNDIWHSRNKGVSWTQLTSQAQWTARTGHTLDVMPNGRVILSGGHDGSSKNDVWAWHTATSLEQNPTYTYTTPGTYDVTLQAFNQRRCNRAGKENYITVSVMPAYDSELISTHLPARLPVKQPFLMTLTMLNTGTETWRTTEGISLGAVGNHDNLTPSENWRVFQEQEVPPQETYTYEIELYPEEPGIFTTEWQMVKEGEFWFGEIFSQEVEVHPRTDVQRTLWHLFE